MWTWTAVESFGMDVAYALRQLRRNPGFAVVAVLTLALGIGANTAIFSVVNAVLLQPLPFADPDRLVEARETEQAPGTYPVNPADYLDWQAQNRSFDATTIFSWTYNQSMAGPNASAAAAVTEVQANFFQLLGIRPVIGRSFATGEDVAGKNRIALLSYAFWQQHFGKDARAIGRTVKLDAEKYTVIGVMPASFRFPATTDVWTPFDMRDKHFTTRGNHGYNVLGRMKHGVTLAQAQQDLLAISLRLEKQFPDANHKVHAILFPLKDRLVGGVEERLFVLLGAVALVLLIACVNVANLLLARSAARQREIALRTSLGAGRLRIVRQLLTESMVLASSGAMLGSVGAWFLLRSLDRATTPFVPRFNPIGIDGTVLVFTFALGALSAVLFGLVPALQISGTQVNDSLKGAAQGVAGSIATRQRFRNALIVGEIAVTLALLVGAGLLLRSFSKLQRAGIGIDPRNLLTTSISLPDVNYPTLEARRRFFNELLERTRRIPGVQSAALSNEIPLEGGNNGYIQVDGASDPSLASTLIGFGYVTPDYFRTFGIPMLRGRIFDQRDLDHDGAAAEKAYKLFLAAGTVEPKFPADLALHAILSETASRTFWKNQDPLGKTFRWNGLNVVVVGIVGDVKEYGIRAKTIAQAYFPHTVDLSFGGSANLTVKTAITPTAILPDLRRNIQALDRGLAIFRPRTMAEVIGKDTQDARVQTLLLGVFSALALILAAVGLYGVMSYTVTQRTREIGIRMAIGANRTDVLRMILWHGVRLTLAGLVSGLLLAAALSRLITGLLYGVGPLDATTFLGVAALLAAIATTAYVFPARRATTIDPMLSLRYE